MVTVPAFLLKRLYVKGSLKPTPDGFEFRVENKLGSGYATEMLPVTLDGTPFPLEQSYFQSDDGGEVRFSEVGSGKTFTLEVGKGMTIGVHDVPAPIAGPHKVGLGFVVQGISPLSFEVSDVVA
jgi:hydroxymethylglutaryl-CoA reductase (NADPH)